MIRVLQIIPSLEDGGGVQKRLLDNYLNMNRDEIQFDFIVHGKEVGELEAVVEKLNCSVYHVTRKKDGYIKNFLDIYDVINKGHYDIVQSHMAQADAFSILLAKCNGVKVRISHSHLSHLKIVGVKKIYCLILSKLINFWATDFWACSKAAGEWLFRKDREDLRVIPNAINVSKFRFDQTKRKMMRYKMGIENDLAVVNIGRLFSQKNQKFLLKVAKEMIGKNSKVRLFVIGDGELKEDLTKEAKDLAILTKVEFLGTRKDVADILQGMDLMLHPALFEGLGNVLIEAQAAGLPIVASDEGIPKETRITNIIRYVSLGKSAEEWARISLDQAKIGRHDTSEKVIEANYDCAIQGHNLELLYKTLLKQREAKNV